MAPQAMRRPWRHRRKHAGTARRQPSAGRLRRWVDVENLARHRELNEQRVLREDVLLLVAHHGE